MSSDCRTVLTTLFDRAYLVRGLAMLDSLESCSRAGRSWRLIVHALDDETAKAIRQWSGGRDWIEVRAPEQVMALNPRLDQLRQQRSPATFCWTLTPLVLLDALNGSASLAVYVDADLWFHADPGPWLDRLASTAASVHITPHGFAAHADSSASVGRYCVQFLPVRNDPAGLAVVERWAQQCLADCPEAGGDRPPGDQGYLDEWPAVHGAAVAEWDEPGVGCGPWNRERHRIRHMDDGLVVSRDGGAWRPLLFVHHQDVKWIDGGALDEGRLLSWPIDRDWLRVAILPYIARCAELDPARRLQASPSWPFWLRWLRQQLKRA